MLFVYWCTQKCSNPHWLSVVNHLWKSIVNELWINCHANLIDRQLWIIFGSLLSINFESCAMQTSSTVSCESSLEVYCQRSVNQLPCKPHWLSVVNHLEGFCHSTVNHLIICYPVVLSLSFLAFAFFLVLELSTGQELSGGKGFLSGVRCGNMKSVSDCISHPNNKLLSSIGSKQSKWHAVRLELRSDQGPFIRGRSVWSWLAFVIHYWSLSWCTFVMAFVICNQVLGHGSLIWCPVVTPYVMATQSWPIVLSTWCCRPAQMSLSSCLVFGRLGLGAHKNMCLLSVSQSSKQECIMNAVEVG